MLPAVFVFLVTTGGIVGVYVFFARRPAAKAQQRVDRRLRDIVPADIPGNSVVVSGLTGPLPGFGRRIANTAAGAWLSRLIEQSGVHTTPGSIILFSLLAAVAGGLIASLLVAAAVARLGGVAVGLAMPCLYLMRRRAVRLRKFEEQFPEALDLLSRAIRAGHAFQTGMGMVADELPAPVGLEFKKTFERQNFGLALRDSLDELSERVPLMDVRFFVTAVTIQRETGGNLSEILDNLARVVRERFKLLRQVRVYTAHGRFTGYVLLALPAGLGLMLWRLNPDMMEPLFVTAMGQMMLIAAMVLQTVGFVWIRQVIKIEV